MYDCNKCANNDSNVCLHCFKIDGGKPPYFVRMRDIDYKNLLEERSEIDVKKCSG